MARPRILSKLPAEQASALAQHVLALPDNASVLLDRRGQTIYRFTHHGTDLVAKRYQLKGFTKRLTSFLGASRATRSLQSAERLIAAGINTPEPLMTILTGPLLPTTAYLITTYHHGLQLPEFLRKYPDKNEHIITQIIHLFARFQELRNSHGDFHAKNILVDDKGTISIIDLDGARWHFATHRLRKRYRRDRLRMLESLTGFPQLAKELDAALPPAT